MYIYTNPNPLDKRTGDCVIRALSIVTDESWERIYVELCLKGLKMADLPNTNSVWEAYLREHGYVREVIPNTCPDCYTVGDFAVDHLDGRYVVCTGTHAIAVINGDIYDAWDSSNEIPSYYFFKEDE